MSPIFTQASSYWPGLWCPHHQKARPPESPAGSGRGRGSLTSGCKAKGEARPPYSMCSLRLAALLLGVGV